jgi:hypothetical protein
MTPTQLRTALDKLDITQVGLARMIGKDGSTVRRWISGVVPVDETVAILLRLMLAGKVAERDVERARLNHA